MFDHTEDTELTMHVAFFHPRHDTWFLNKSQGYMIRHRDEYKPTVHFIQMCYSAQSGSLVDITPVEDIVVGMTRNEAWFRMDEGAVAINERVSVHDLLAAYLEDGNCDRHHYKFRRMTEGDKFLLQLTVSYHGGTNFTIHDILLQGHASACRFISPSQ